MQPLNIHCAAAGGGGNYWADMFSGCLVWAGLLGSVHSISAGLSSEPRLQKKWIFSVWSFFFFLQWIHFNVQGHCPAAGQTPWHCTQSKPPQVTMLLRPPSHTSHDGAASSSSQTTQVRVHGRTSTSMIHEAAPLTNPDHNYKPPAAPPSPFIDTLSKWTHEDFNSLSL